MCEGSVEWVEGNNTRLDATHGLSPSTTPLNRNAKVKTNST